MREFLNRVRMNLGATPAVNAFVDPDEKKKHERACPHQKIYDATDRTRIDFASFLKDLARQANIPPGLIRINFKDVYLSSDTAVFCGFILKELLANYIDVNPDEKGLVIIGLTLEGDLFNLTLTDYGNHFNPEIDLRESQSISARLIMFLAQQINGTIEFNRNPSEFRLSFSEPGLLESLQL